jgi:hypothetical protein
VLNATECGGDCTFVVIVEVPATNNELDIEILEEITVSVLYIALLDADCRVVIVEEDINDNKIELEDIIEEGPSINKKFEVVVDDDDDKTDDEVDGVLEAIKVVVLYPALLEVDCTVAVADELLATDV